jgi:hypothetical protein
MGALSANSEQAAKQIGHEHTNNGDGWTHVVGWVAVILLWKFTSTKREAVSLIVVGDMNF